jgi:transposase
MGGTFGLKIYKCHGLQDTTKYLGLSLRQLVEELEGIRVALVQGKLGGKVDLVVEEMDAKQARLFSLLDLGKFMGK